MKQLLFIPIGLLFAILVGCSQTTTDYSNQKAVSLNSSESSTPKPATSTTTPTPTAAPTATPTPVPTPQPTPQKPDLELVESHSMHDEFSSYVVGTVKNNTSARKSYVAVEINLYDKDGNQVGSTLDNTTNLEAGGTWKFKAVVIEDNVSKYKIVKVEGM